jgi:DNA-binding transcriptional LysR family regulator
MSKDARGPSLELLNTLLAFAERGEVAAVAALIGLDPAVISRRLRELRLEYGLIVKQGRELVLTDKGRAALPAVRSMLRQHKQLTEWLKDRQAKPQALSIATGSFGARFYLPRALAQFQEQHPDWQVRVQIRRGRDRILGVADGTFDLAIVSHDATQIRAILGAARVAPGALRSEPLAEHLLYLVAGKDTSFGAELARSLDGQMVPLSWLSAFPLVGLDPQSGIRRQLEAQVRGKSRELCFRFEAGGWEAAKEYARHGLGVAVLPFPLIGRDDRKDFIIRRLPLGIHIQDLLIERDEKVGPAHEAMMLALTKAADPSFRDERAP